MKKLIWFCLVAGMCLMLFLEYRAIYRDACTKISNLSSGFEQRIENETPSLQQYFN